MRNEGKLKSIHGVVDGMAWLFDDLSERP